MKKPLHFKIIVPGWKADHYIKKCLTSINTQTYKNWECQVHLDESDTKTYEYAKTFESDKIHVHVNDGRFGPVYNCRKGVQLLSPSDDDVIIVLDADDWFANKKVLSLIKKYYDMNDDLLMTYGSWKEFPKGGVNGNNSFPYTKTEFKDLRSAPFHVAVPRTMKCKLWNMVKDEDLQDDEGNYYMYGADVLLYTPMLEIAGYEYSKFIKEKIYIYNRETPFNDDKIHVEEQAEIAAKITNLDIYNHFDVKEISLLSNIAFDYFNLKAERTRDRIKWYTDEIKDMTITVDDRLLNDKQYDDTINVAMLIEPSSIKGRNYEYIKNNYYKYDHVLTYDKSLLNIDSKFKFYPHGSSWIRIKDWKIYPKIHNVSIIASGKKVTSGHQFRHMIIDRYKNYIDMVCGRGYSSIDYKLSALKDFRFSIVVENDKFDYYFTEKLIDCFVTGTIPIYWGCPSIGKFFDTRGMIIINDISDLNNILKSDNLTHEYLSRMSYIIKNYGLALKYTKIDDWLDTNFLNVAFGNIEGSDED